MGLEARGRGNLLIKDFDGRQLQLETVVDIGGDVRLTPYAVDWEAQKLDYGRQLAIRIADHVVPQILGQLGIIGKVVPGTHVHHTYDLKSDWDIAPKGPSGLDIRQQVRGVFRLESRGEMSPGDLIMAARDSIAMALAENAVFALECQFEGKTMSDTQTAVRREDGEIVEFTRRNIPPPSLDGNLTGDA